MPMTRKQVLDEICKPWAIGMNEILADMTDEERDEWADNYKQRMDEFGVVDAAHAQQVKRHAIEDWEQEGL